MMRGNDRGAGSLHGSIEFDTQSTGSAIRHVLHLQREGAQIGLSFQPGISGILIATA
ncbi:MAG: hypothetical protein OXB95_14230 [Rhodobacteraceae bacterium]|nr:hypothetical protein [Paracoccaceae bacterium]